MLDPEELGGFVDFVCSKFHPAHAAISTVRRETFKTELLERVDMDNDGRLDWNEFISFIALLSSPLQAIQKKESKIMVIHITHDLDAFF